MEEHLLQRPQRSHRCLRATVLVFILLFFIHLWTSEVRLYAESSERNYPPSSSFLEGISNDSISNFLKDITREPHVAGTPENFATANYVREAFERAGLSTHYSDFDVLLTYPVKRKLSLVFPDGSERNFLLKEEPIEGDPYTKNPRVIPTFFAFSKSGTVTGEVVYANYGREQDFDLLKRNGVKIKGAVVIARYGKIFRGDIVSNAADAGALAAIVYSDPRDYASNGTQEYYPSSKWLPPSGVQRGSIFSTSGDPLTPGWPSVEDAERLEISEKMLSKIPGLPISGQDAFPILEALGGDVGPPEWQGGLDLAYRIGRGPAKLKLTYVGNETVTPIRNVIAVIKGSEDPDKYVMLGNHRDAWVFGAADPSSGTACLLETARGFGRLLKQGWQPRRTIVLCSWDAEEYGLIGSTEWMERNFKLLFAGAVAYVNVDRAVGGPKFDGSATPQLDKILLEVTKKVKDPNSKFDTVYEAWSALNNNSTPYVGRLGNERSDFAPFFHSVGIPSYDIRYQRGYPVYHTLYDDYLWMSTFGDPHFKRHVAVSAICGLLAIRLADDEFIPFDFAAYADELETSTKALKQTLASSNVTTVPLSAAISKFRAACVQAEEQMKTLRSHDMSQRKSLNDRLVQVERSFLEPGKPWYKHLIYGPTAHNRYGGDLFPGINDAVNIAMSLNGTQGWSTVQHEIWKVSRAVNDAASVLTGELV